MVESSLISQNAAILAHLKTGASLTALEALERFRCFRLAARINDLRSKGKWGKDIETTFVRTSTGKMVASYRLRDERERATVALGLTVYAPRP